MLWVWGENPYPLVHHQGPNPPRSDTLVLRPGASTKKNTMGAGFGRSVGVHFSFILDHNLEHFFKIKELKKESLDRSIYHGERGLHSGIDRLTHALQAESPASKLVCGLPHSTYKTGCRGMVDRSKQKPRVDATSYNQVYNTREYKLKILEGRKKWWDDTKLSRHSCPTRHP